MTTIDETGAEVPDMPPPAADNVRDLGAARKRARGRRVKGNSMTGLADGSIGARIEEMLHPGQVQAEYGALGQPVPSKASIIIDSAAAAAGDIPDALAQGVDNLGHGIQTTIGAGLDIGKILLIGVAVYAILEFTADRKLKRYSGD